MEPVRDLLTDRLDLKSMRRDELEALAERLGQPRFRGRQLFKWLFGKGATTFEEMTDLPKTLRMQLAESADLAPLRLEALHTSRDGTVKGLFSLASGHRIETVLIPDFDDDGTAKRLTVCVSSQVGCAMGCTFCATGLMGFRQNLSAGEIFEQVRFMNEEARRRYGRSITNIVYMGMGEPLLNYDNVLRSVDLLTDPDGPGLSPRRITVSTVGLARRIRQLADDGTRFNLAVSLHAPTDEKRSAIMPVNRRAATDLDALEEAIRYYIRKTRRRITYEYCLFAGVNDTDEDAHALARIVARAPGKVNLIQYNPVAGLDFAPTSEEQLNRFIRLLVAHGVTVTVRRSRGRDIDAACGQLAVRET
ncbi:23S rRNA (adenine(2503)-C(2))-methyltransferase RlmN [Rhodocaloribacter litoris]|uniref:23S rRNA (adenine(2503)-C(2))-methyltransferase RlmN n=1 Tax=Rhodocaloribacter litoris TaxID=2558931 RepID=UPI00141D7AF7|nr:23S rRNA (adenine(2503)-C(2))-methyltransferase RlmN [Rhodocaloribacter litoris]QXD14896.1 23S rRNA (adenine(2503)-C(2))-methyltransferase RlmN [Rhodocaloribacter litoris]GIV59008.1 MAG: putative dual-specificity RNA methyltransferase RlmN [Rhodothermaceae bacterium]